MTQHEFAECGGRISGTAMPRTRARFRLSIKDHLLQQTLKVEMIETRSVWGDRRYQLRVNGRNSVKMKEGTLTEIFDRLRRWLVKRTG